MRDNEKPTAPASPAISPALLLRLCGKLKVVPQLRCLICGNDYRADSRKPHRRFPHPVCSGEDGEHEEPVLDGNLADACVEALVAQGGWRIEESCSPAEGETRYGVRVLESSGSSILAWYLKAGDVGPHRPTAVALALCQALGIEEE